MDIVAFDQYGYPHIYSIAYALDRMPAYPVNATPIRDDLNMVAGTYWISMYPNNFKVSHCSLR